MTIHPLESLPAYLLGALPADEARCVAAHVQCCRCCRAELEACRHALGLTSGNVGPAPAPRVKQCLLRRIAADLRKNAPMLRDTERGL